MRIGKQDNAATSICTSDATSITVRGMDLCSEVIGHVDFTSYFWLLVTGTMPAPAQKALADAVLCAIAEHGLVPSVVATRMTYAAAPEAFHGAVAAGLLGCGSVVLGSAEVAGKFYAQIVAQVEAEGTDPAAAATVAIKALRAEKKTIPGFGHPQHSGAIRARTVCSRWLPSTAWKGRTSPCCAPSNRCCPRRSAAASRSTSTAPSPP